MVSSGNTNSNTKKILILLNIIAVFAAVHAVDMAETEDIAPESELVQNPPDEVLLPHITVTNEMKVVKFFDKMIIDHSRLDPQVVFDSIVPWDAYIEQYSSVYNVDPDLVRAIIYAESKGNPYSISKDGAVGLMQIMPSTADFLGVSNVIEPEENIRAGVMYIARLVERFDVEYALWAWNAGPSKIKKYQMPGETKRFIVEVLSVKSFLKNDRNKTI